MAGPCAANARRAQRCAGCPARAPPRKETRGRTRKEGSWARINWHPTLLHSEKERAELYSIGELAREFDVTTRAIRFYEAEGLLTPRREGQRRIYTPRDRTRLKLTLRGKRLGLTLSEIRDLIDMYEPGEDQRPQLERFLAVLEAHKDALQRQREDIDAQLAEIAAFEKRVRKQLATRKRS
jgi:DNA-binding transcriptional MerR regulator